MPEFRNPLSLGDALYRALTGKSSRSEGKTTQQRTQDLVKNLTPKGGTEAQGKKRAAQVLGVSLRTVQRRFKGEQNAKGANAEKLSQAQRAARVTPARADQFKGSAKAPSAGMTGAGGLTLSARVRVSEDVRDRDIRCGAYIPQGDLDAVIDRMEEHGPEAAAGQLTQLLRQHYVPGMTIESVDAIYYD